MAKARRRFQVQFVPSAAKALGKLLDDFRRRIVQAVEALETNPRPPGSTKLAVEEDLYRLRVGDYRVIYQIDGRRLLVLIVRIGHRRDIYKERK